MTHRTLVVALVASVFVGLGNHGALAASARAEQVQTALAAAGLTNAPLPDQALIDNLMEQLDAGQAAMKARPLAAPFKPGPITPFSLRAFGQAAVVTGACLGATCKASKGDCVCLETAGVPPTTGTGIATGLSGPFASAITLDEDDCLLDPVGGFCCPANGIAGVVNKVTSPTQAIGMVLEGNWCSTTITTTMTYTIIPTIGKFSQAVGSGSYESTSSSTPQGTTESWVAANGMVQLTAVP